MADLMADVELQLQEFPELALDYDAGDPRLRVQIAAISIFLEKMRAGLAVSELEPFIKTRTRTILADASAKGILPLARAPRYYLQVVNSGGTTVTLGAGRTVSDGQGRIWRLLASVQVAGGATVDALFEQSEVRDIEYTVSLSEPLHTVMIALQPGQSLADIPLVSRDGVAWRYSPKWMNVMAGDRAFNLIVDDLRRMMIQFGMEGRAGVQPAAGDTFMIQLTETFGQVDTSLLAEAALTELAAPSEADLYIRFAGGYAVTSGANPPDLTLLRQLATYPALYDESAVYLGNFDMLVRRFFGMRCEFISVWNEAIHEQHFGADIHNINRIFVSVVATDPASQAQIEADISLKIVAADDLYLGRVVLVPVREASYPLRITGKIAPVHSADVVADQIRQALLAEYGKGSVATSRPLLNGINLQQAASVIRQQVTAFQDRISDFAVTSMPMIPPTPATWSYLTPDSIVIELQRTADEASSTGNAWGL